MLRSLNRGAEGCSRNGTRDHAGKAEQADCGERATRNRQRAADQQVIASTNPRPERGAPPAGAAVVEQQHPERGRERERNQHRRDHRKRERQRHRVQVGRGQALGEEHGSDREQHDQRSVPERAAKLRDRLEDHRLQWHRLAVARALPDPSDQRRGPPDGVVDDHSRGDQQAEHQQCVEGVAERVEHEQRRDQRQRHRHDRQRQRAKRRAAGPPARGSRAPRRSTARAPDCRSALSTYPAGLKNELSIVTPVSAGASSFSACSTPLVTPGTLADGSFCTSSTSPDPLPVTALPIRAWWLCTTCATLPSVGLPGASEIGTAARSFGAPSGSTGRISTRWLGPSRKPPVPGAEPSRYVSGETSWALPAVSITCCSVTCARGELGWVDLDLDLAVLLAEDRHVGDAGDPGQARLDHPPRKVRQLERARASSSSSRSTAPGWMTTAAGSAAAAC